MPKFAEILEEAYRIALEKDIPHVAVAIKEERKPMPRYLYLYEMCIDLAFGSLKAREEEIAQLTTVNA